MPTRGLLSLCLLSLVACRKPSPPPAPATPDLAPVEACPPKPNPEDAKRGKDWHEPVGANGAPLPAATLQAWHGAIQKKLPALCSSLLADVKQGKPLPAQAVAIDDANELRLDDATLSADIRKIAILATTCRAISTGSQAPCSTLPAEGRTKCLLDWSTHNDVHHDKKERISQADVDACKASNSPEGCEAYRAAILGGAPDKCPRGAGDCVARASLDASKCPEGTDHDSCAMHVARDRAAVGKAGAGDAKPVTAHDPADDCAHVDEWFASVCGDSKLVKPKAAAPAAR